MEGNNTEGNDISVAVVGMHSLAPVAWQDTAVLHTTSYWQMPLVCCHACPACPNAPDMHMPASRHVSS